VANPDTLPVVSLYQALQQLPDPRRGQGKRYSLALVLCLLLLAKLAGQKSLSRATEWIRHRRLTLAERFGLKGSSMPCQMSSCNVLALLDGHHLDAILSAFFERWEAQSRCGDQPSRLQTPEAKADHRHLASAGKTLRATSKQAHPVHQLVSTGRVVWHCNVQEKHNESSALKPFLTTVTVKGRILSLDASIYPTAVLCAGQAASAETMCSLPKTISRP
jgi:hypothetical protein